MINGYRRNARPNKPSPAGEGVAALRKANVLATDEVLHLPRVRSAGVDFVLCEHIPLSFAYYALFFLKKTALKNDFTVFRYAETGECLRTPGGGLPLLPPAEVVEALPRLARSKNSRRRRHSSSVIS